MAFDPITSVIDLIKTGVDKFLPDKMSEAEREKLKNDMAVFTLTQAKDENSSFRQFVVEYEGAAKDYVNVPVIGPLILLLRGVIRPAFTILVGYLDFLYITPSSGGTWPPDSAQLLFWMNIIVLTFWFGERAINNTGLMGALENFIKAKK